VFNTLEKHDIDLIIEIELKKLYARLTELGYKLTLSEKAKAFIAEKVLIIWCKTTKRAIQKYVEDSLAEEIITLKFLLRRNFHGLKKELKS
jgi:ATP-dependent Clp protease ATP-binding subunit ClpC